MTRRDRMAAIAGALLLLLVAAPVLSMVLAIWQQGQAVISVDFLLQDPARAGKAGGIASLIISTAWILAVCLAVAVPVGLGCALYLSEEVPPGSRREQGLGFVLDVLAATPSIVFGLFGYQLFAITLGFGFSILSGGLALSLMVLPLMIRSGWITRILVPSAASGIAVGIILSIGRALAETAVLLFTAGYVLRRPDSVLDSGRALSVHIYDMAMHVPGGADRAAATALVLVTGLVMINALVRMLLRNDRQGDHA
jgi:phosphate transport system permease protein